MSFVECNTRQRLRRVFFGLRRVPWTHGKAGHSGSEQLLCAYACHGMVWEMFSLQLATTVSKAVAVMLYS